MSHYRYLATSEMLLILEPSRYASITEKKEAKTETKTKKEQKKYINNSKTLS